MKTLKKIIKKIHSYFPITQKTYDYEINGILNNIDLIIKAIDGFRLSEKQISATNMQILEKLGELNKPKVSEKNENNKKDEHVEFG